MSRRAATGRRGWWAPLGVVVVGLCAREAGAEEPPARPPVLVDARGSACPDAAQVLQALRARLPGWTVSEAPSAGAVRVRVRDQGRGYRLEVGARKLRFIERKRQCRSRAKNVADAAFVVLTLHAPAEPEPEPPPPSATPVTPPPAPVMPAVVAEPVTPPPADPAPAAMPEPRRFAIELEADGALGFALREDRSLALTGGGGLRIGFERLGALRAGASLGVAGTSPITLRLAAGDGSLVERELHRVPLDLSAHVGFARGRVEAGAQAGAALSLLLLDGELRAEAAARLGLYLRVRAHERVAPLLAAHALVPFVPQEIRLERTMAGGATQLVGTGTAPSLVFSVTLGLAIRVW